MNTISGSQAIKHLFMLPLLLCFGFVANHERLVKIHGELTGLPDGTIFLLTARREMIDSAKTRNGSFLLNIRSQNNQAIPYSFVILEHRDHSNVRRLFSFKTNKAYQNTPWNPGVFIGGDC